MPATTVRVVTANIRSNPRQRFIYVRNRIRQALKSAGPGGVTFLQECDPSKLTLSPYKGNRRRYSAVAAAEAKRVRKEVFGGNTEIPIILDTAVWRVVKHDVVDVHGGLAHVSPDRDIVAVWAAHRKTGAKVLFLNLHPVSKGHYAASKRGVSSLAWRRSHLVMYMNRLAGLVKAGRADGYTAVYGGDMNDPTPSRVHPEQEPLNNAGLDHLFVVPAAGAHVGSGRRWRSAPTKAMDHPILGAQFNLAP